MDDADSGELCRGVCLFACHVRETLSVARLVDQGNSKTRFGSDDSAKGDRAVYRRRVGSPGGGSYFMEAVRRVEEAVMPRLPGPHKAQQALNVVL